jgi:DNA-binding transcriptional ArsR family regulator
MTAIIVRYSRTIKLSDSLDHVRALPEPAAADLDLASLFHALGDPVRLELVRSLAGQGEITCAPAGLDIPKSTLSNHWRILREAGLTATVVDGRTHRMRLRAADLEDRFPGLLGTVLRAASRDAAHATAGNPQAGQE